ncbi:hypothetical protein PVAND_014712 [Polypedilum vanderplanki]|uniref:Uncharacterized protein n=1 Tax=Polypedilum vanderplanki TaxID=319348 RepID=A0A9J6B9Z1_POLVA|nr:hypothetical protein PVAND_014712 [Polypedilum vanderplanki]
MKFLKFLLFFLSLSFVKQSVNAGSTSFSESSSDFPPLSTVSMEEPSIPGFEEIKQSVTDAIANATAAVADVLANHSAVIDQSVQLLQSFKNNATPDEIEIINQGISALEALRLNKP